VELKKAIFLNVAEFNEMRTWPLVKTEKATEESCKAMFVSRPVPLVETKRATEGNLPRDKLYLPGMLKVLSIFGRSPY
jgi:hypothetical protein